MSQDQERSRFQSWRWWQRLGVGCGLWLLVASLTACQSPMSAQGTLVKVEQIANGQAIEISPANNSPGTPERVRLIGIDAPDLAQQPWGPAAKQQLERLIGSKPVLLEPGLESRDRYERTLAYVWLDGKLLNEKLVEAGYALAVPRSPNTKYDQRLKRAQEKARLMGVGIWNPNEPMRLTPAEFRAQNR
ncbi:thermonuclease family protein [Trichocoleus desertorum]|uniref:Thermonuclease family protein n=1 Tax=Trichocoleus desertorum GB2-A4 TaxID=2933944 RepID=A0ABV0J9N7_9CYAN